MGRRMESDMGDVPVRPCSWPLRTMECRIEVAGRMDVHVVVFMSDTHESGSQPAPVH